MIYFKVDSKLCTKCRSCVADCPARIIEMGDYPFVPAEAEASCYKCQHCLTICPTAAVSILGLQPENSLNLAGNYPDPLQLETLIRGRRSFRQYEQEDLPKELIQELLDVAWQAPTGVNFRQVRFTVVDDMQKFMEFKKRLLEKLGELINNGQLAGRLKEKGLESRFDFFISVYNLWEDKGVDVLFRGAPHMLIATAPANAPCAVPDCMISLSYFELYAQAKGVGTVWDGLATYAINSAVTESREWLKIPEDHIFGYVMVFGKPAIKYMRAVQHGPADVVRY
ncbi:MAG: nitroreductase family protein [Desulfuromonadales bacterium]|nr:nitroreductase family protein [Desulfuromonadales bacterium]